MIIAGDPSGDEHAADVLRRFKENHTDLHAWGIGGPAMVEQGFEPLLPFAEFNRMGFSEVVRHLPFFYKARKLLTKAIIKRKPSVVLCVDYPGFNIPIMKQAYRLGAPVIWYIVPQVWAWKKKRAAILGKFASHIACVFPFEQKYFTGYKAKVSFVGHPLVEKLATKSAGKLKSVIDPASFTLGVLPGSRPQEITRMLGPFIDAALLVRQQFPGCRIVVSRYRGLDLSLFERCKSQNIECFDGPLEELLVRCDCAIVTSGTATLTCALMEIPMVIAYRTSRLTYLLAKNFISISSIGLPNIVAGKKIVPECIQNEASPQHLAKCIEEFVTSPDHYGETRESLRSLRNILGEKKPSVEIAALIASQQ